MSNQTINGRTLVEGKCECGIELQQWLKDGESVCCMDCRDNRSREQNGWTPENSRD